MFWKLSNVESDDAYGRSLADWDNDVDIEQITCPINPEHQRGGRRLTDLRIVLPNRAVQDVVWGWGGDCFIQDHILTTFKDAKLSGFEVAPVMARIKQSTENPPRLWELCVTGSAGMASPESGISLIEQCPACGLMVYSGCSNRERLIDVSKWDGSDFFLVQPLGYIFVTDRVVDLVQNKHVSGVKFQSLTDLPLRPDETY